ncbi:hypothetical protein N9N28_04480 [Rubripirellula amarantea]|nr:hypothetical protein [Rubripirellula amarantea]
MNKIQWTLASVALLSMVGCAALNDAKYENTQKARAVLEYHKCGKPECERYPHDYKLGWLDGFYTISTGGPNCPPAVAPQRYWNPKQVLDDCDNRRHAFYSGWQDGAARATQFPDTHHLRIFETCECPMPRCEMPCGTGACGPCGANYLGASAYTDLIEMPYTETIIPSESELPVPPAPMIDGEADQSALEYNGDEVLEADASVGMISTPETLVTQDIAAVPHEDLLKANDADTIFGAAFDVMLPSDATVQLQSSDPIENLQNDAVAVKATAIVQTIVVEEKDLAKEELEKQRQAAITKAKLEEERIAAAKLAQAKIAEEKLKQEKLAQTKLAEVSNAQPAIKIPVPVQDQGPATTADAKQATAKPVVDNAPVQRAQEITIAEDKPTAKSDAPVAKSNSSVKSNATQQASVSEHPEVAVKMLPVTFEMIESDQPPVVLAK